MPPRRATRAAGSTPTRAPPPAAQPSTKDFTPGKSTALDSTPLPDLEAEQSFAYGSSNTKPLPQQLVARRKMTIKQMAETLDAGIIQAGRNFQAQREEAEQYGLAISDARAARAARRSSTRESRESSVASDQTPVPRSSNRPKGLSAAQTQRWLQDIQEEAGSHNEADPRDELGRRVISSASTGSDPSPPPTARVEESSMPDLHRFDQTYTQERDIHIHGSLQPPINAWGRLIRSLTVLRHFLLANWDRLRRYLNDGDYGRGFSRYRTLIFTVAATCIALFVSNLICRRASHLYCESQRASEPSRPWHYPVHQLCRFYGPEKLSADSLNAADTSTDHVGRLIKKLKQQEQLVQEMQAQQSLTSATIDQMTGLQSELLKQQSELEMKLAEAKASEAAASARFSKSSWHPSAFSPVLRRINYAAPGIGAVIDPYLTSPTKAKHFPLYQRILLGSAAIKKYQSRPPIEALMSWSELGDCWCAAATRRPDEPVSESSNQDGQGGRYTQLSILLGHAIFPDEIVIEHLPLTTTPFPGSAPKDIEVWADLSHLSPHQLTALQRMSPPQALQQQPGWSSSSSPQHLILLSRLRYNATANKQGSPVQAFPLDFQRDHLADPTSIPDPDPDSNIQTLLSTTKLLLRITSNYGAANTCLYRVRVHGRPVHPHPDIIGEDFN